MRLRNIKGADEAILKSDLTLNIDNWDKKEIKEKPVYLEIGCGKGQFILKQAVAHPENMYIGIELYSSVLLRALQKTEKYFETEKPLDNLKFMCVNAEKIQEIFGEDKVSGIYLNFSDPWPKARHAKRRLTSSRFLSIYKKILKPKARIEFKTDNRDLFEFSVEEVENDKDFEIINITRDLYKDEEMLAGNISTEYEDKFVSLGNPINKIVFVRK